MKKSQWKQEDTTVVLCCVEAARISSVSLPVKNSHSDVDLHVLIQRLQENNDKREEEECEDMKLKPKDKELKDLLEQWRCGFPH